MVDIPIPDVFVVSEDVARGKPSPDPYLLGAERAGVKPESCQLDFLISFALTF